MRQVLACECRVAGREGRSAAGGVCVQCDGAGQVILQCPDPPVLPPGWEASPDDAYLAAVTENFERELAELKAKLASA
jgi:hypothetical protein